MVMNMNMYSSEANSINEYLSDTVASVFPYVYTVRVPGTTNTELFACTEPDALDRMLAAMSSVDDSELLSVMNDVADNMETYSAGDLILTDDKAPVEMLGMKVIDEIIGNELDYYREIFREQGLGALFE